MRFPESWSSASLAKTRWQKHPQDKFVLDTAFALIEGHPPGLTPDISYSLGNYSDGSAYYALDIQVAPGAPHTTAVTRGADVDPAAQGGITIFDDSTPRPTSTPEATQTYDSLQWGSDASVLYAADSEAENIGFDFYTLSVSSAGVVLNQDYPNVFWNPGRIHYDSTNGLIYSDDGFHAVDPTTGLPAGLYEVGGGWPMAPDSTLGIVFIFDHYIWQENSNYTIDLFDMTHYVPVARIPLSTVQSGINSLGRFIRWGTNGLAVNDTAGNLYLISGPFVSANPNSRSQTPAQNLGRKQ